MTPWTRWGCSEDLSQQFCLFRIMFEKKKTCGNGQLDFSSWWVKLSAVRKRLCWFSFGSFVLNAGRLGPVAMRPFFLVPERATACLYGAMNGTVEQHRKKNRSTWVNLLHVFLPLTISDMWWSVSETILFVQVLLCLISCLIDLYSAEATREMQRWSPICPFALLYIAPKLGSRCICDAFSFATQQVAAKLCKALLSTDGRQRQRA